MTRRFAPAIPLADLTETMWDAQLFRGPKSLAALLGWKLRYHTLRSKGSTSGFPDRVLVRDRVIFAELKTEKGKPTDSQVDWLTALAAAGAETYVWRPSDLDEIGKILSSRWRFTGYRRWSEDVVQLPCLQFGVEPVWQPASLWLPEGHRNDQHVQTTL